MTHFHLVVYIIENHIFYCGELRINVYNHFNYNKSKESQFVSNFNMKYTNVCTYTHAKVHTGVYMLRLVGAGVCVYFINSWLRSFSPYF